MLKESRYKKTDQLSDVIGANSLLLPVITRFGIPLGFGEKTIDELCQAYDVDTKTVLAILNFIEENYTRVQDNVDDLSLPTIINYLERSHTYFLDYCLPTIRAELIDAIADDESQWTSLLLNLFDEYTAEIRKHMNYEDKNVFTFARALLNGERPKNFQITTFSKHHAPIDRKLTELKNVIIRYYPASTCNDRLNAALSDIFACERELDSHCKVEDYVFVPIVLNLERKMTK